MNYFELFGFLSAGTRHDIQHNCRDNDDTDDNITKGYGSAHELKSVLQDSPDTCSGDNACQDTCAAQSGDSADNAGRYRVHLIGGSGVHGSHSG